MFSWSEDTDFWSMFSLLVQVYPKAHLSRGCHSCACVTVEQTFTVKLSFFHVLFGHFSSAEKMKF